MSGKPSYAKASEGEKKNPALRQDFSGLGIGKEKVLIPAKLCVRVLLGGSFSYLFGFMIMFKRRKVNARHQFILHVIQCIVQGFHKTVKIFFVQENFVLLVAETLVVGVKALLTFRDRHVKVIGTGRFHIKEIGTLARLHLLRENFIPTVSL